MQLLPGLSFIDASQRAVEGYSFFGSGSFKPSWSVLLLVPDIFGGDGILHQPAFFNTYNLPEVTAYVGLLPLCAVVACATVAFGRRRDERSADLWFWLFLTVVGILAAFGEYTPLGGSSATSPSSTGPDSRAATSASLPSAWLPCSAFGPTACSGGHGRRRARRVAALGDGLPADCGRPHVHRRHCDPGHLRDRLRGGAVDGGARRAAPTVAVVAARRRGRGDRPARLMAAHRAPGAAPPARRLRRHRPAGLHRGRLDGSHARTGDRDALPDLSAAVLGTNGRFGIYDTSATNSDELTQIGQPDSTSSTGPPA